MGSRALHAVLGVGVARCFCLWLWFCPPFSFSLSAERGRAKLLSEEGSAGNAAFCSRLACIFFFFSLSWKKGLRGTEGPSADPCAPPPGPPPALRGEERRGLLGAGPGRASGDAVAERSGCGRLWGLCPPGCGAAPPGAGWRYRPSPSAARYLHQIAVAM